MSGDNNAPIGADIIAEAQADATTASANGEPAAPVAPPALIDYTKEARDFVQFARGLVVVPWPSLQLVYTDASCELIAQRLGAVFEKYQVTTGALFGKYGPELMLAFTVVQLARPTLDAIRHDNAQAKKQPIPAAGVGGTEETAGTSGSAESPLNRFADGLNAGSSTGPTIAKT
jgi:hypothetical protein